MLASRVRKDNRQIDADYELVEKTISQPPPLPPLTVIVPKRLLLLQSFTLPLVSTGDTVTLSTSSFDQVTNAAAVATQVTMTEQNGLKPISEVGWYTIHAKVSAMCARCGMAGEDGAELGVDAANYKFIVAHELGHVVQDKATGNNLAGPDVYDWWSTTNNNPPVCRCDHVTDLGFPWPAPIGGFNRIDCLQAKMGDLGGLSEGFAHFYASRIFNQFSPSASCRFVYYKEYFSSGGAITAPNTALDCKAAVQWMETKCAAPMTYKATERDHMSFLYALNVASASAATTMDDAFEILRRSCRPTTWATQKCAPGDTWHWAQLRKAASDKYGGTSSKFIHFDLSGTTHGVDN